MVMRTVGGVRTGENVEDLREFVRHLEGAPDVHETVVLDCARHDDERPTWTYVEADAAEGVARRRCVQCAATTGVLDSDARWTFPPMWSCGTCSQSIAEVVAGLSVEDGEHVTWVVLAARCVECGRLDGLTDLVLPGVRLTEVVGRL